MSSERPPEEAELQRPVGYTCLNCDDWGCARCVAEPATRARIQAALDELRAERDRWKSRAEHAEKALFQMQEATKAFAEKLEARHD